jgi:hypothetical protein
LPTRTSPCLRGKSTINGSFSIATLAYWRVIGWIVLWMILATIRCQMSLPRFQSRVLLNYLMFESQNVQKNWRVSGAQNLRKQKVKSRDGR